MSLCLTISALHFTSALSARIWITRTGLWVCLQWIMHRAMWNYFNGSLGSAVNTLIAGVACSVGH